MEPRFSRPVPVYRAEWEHWPAQRICGSSTSIPNITSGVLGVCEHVKDILVLPRSPPVQGSVSIQLPSNYSASDPFLHGHRKHSANTLDLLLGPGNEDYAVGGKALVFPELQLLFWLASNGHH